MEDFKTPKAKRPRRSNLPGTPKNCTPVKIPASPFMKQLGWGTAVHVYRLERSPKVGCIRSPWAIKRLIKRESTSSKSDDKPRRSMNNEISERLRKEAEILKNLKHPNIVGFRAFTQSPDGRLALAMEDGQQSLLSVIEDRFEALVTNHHHEGSPNSSNSVEVGSNSFPAWAILRVGSGLSSALSYLHNEALILHGDVKSDNVLIRGDFDAVKLCDFGVSLKVDKKGDILDSEVYLGTKHWLPPEVLEYEVLEAEWEEGDDPLPKINVQADMYSLGLTLWEMLSLKFPHCPTGEESEEEKSEPDEDENELLGTRPPFPEACLKNPVYTPVIELIHCCTDEEPCMRPTSKQAHEFLGLVENSGAMKKPVENDENVPAAANVASD